MKEVQYLIISRKITQNDRGALTFVDVCDNLYIKELPARGKFDIALICGPGWPTGKHSVYLSLVSGNQEPIKIGAAEISIADENRVATLLFNKLNLVIEESENLTLLFQVHRDDHQALKEDIEGELIFERPVKVYLQEQESVASDTDV